MNISQLHITPDSVKSRYLVLINAATPIYLPHARFELLIKALCCRVTKPLGCFIAQDVGVNATSLYKLVERLRNDFGRVLGTDVREALIVNPGRGRYQIGLEKEQVSVDPRMQELVPHELEQRDVDVLLQYYASEPSNVKVASAQTIYDSLEATTTTKKTHSTADHQPQCERFLMKPGILVQATCCGIERLWSQTQGYATERYPFAVDIDVVHVDTTGLATVVVTRSDQLFTDIFTFRYCSAIEFQKLAADFIQGQRHSSSDGDCQSA